MRLHQPIGIWLLMFPCWWSIALSSTELNIKMLILFAIGSLIMRSSGCIINDIIDRDIDRKVERTKNRPLASGEITVTQALTLLAVLFLLGFVILLSLNKLAIIIGLFSVIPIVIYPFMKRITYLPQLFLAITFNWGVLIGFAAIANEIRIEALLLYIAALVWTLAYDTIYAHQDKEDDKKIGIKSTALLLQDKTKPFITVCYAAIIVLFLIIGQIIDYGALYYPFIMAATAHFAWQVVILDIDNPKSCLRVFQSNQWVGLLLFIATLA